MSDAALNAFITRSMPSADEHLDGLGGPQHGRLHVLALVRSEPAEHVIRQVAPRIAAGPTPMRSRESRRVPEVLR